MEKTLYKKTWKKGRGEGTFTISKRKPRWWESVIWMGVIAGILWLVFR